MPVPGITHRYPDRVLFYTTHNCPVYCRHCTRKRKVSDPSTSAQTEQLENGLKYIENTKTIRDVIISGGDPLSLSDDRLEYIIARLRAMDHIEVIRLGSRNLVTLPFRLTDEFITRLKKYAPIHINTHFNHPKECTREAFDVAARLADAGFTLGNQSVLLKGVNDKPEIFKELVHKLMLMRIRPYYIYQCDLSQGISHFRTPVEKGIEIIEHLRGHTSGLCIPQFVVDAPGGGGKIPVNPQYVTAHDGKKWTFRNFRKQKFVYIEP
jgi:lysine 2,3-aminomutase